MDGRKLLRAPPNDPNRTQNRIPSQLELVTLRSIRSNKRQMADHTKRELEMAREAHDRIQTRYDNILREIESIQSELNLSHDYLVTLEKQLEVFQAEDERLAGLLHPIRRCPEEILRMIFEAVKLQRSSRFSFATTVSQVCRSWRAAALTTSSLWKEIDISTNKNTQDIEAFMERWRIRLGSAVPDITLRHIRDRPINEMDAIMQAMGLDKFKDVDLLHYVLDTSQDITQLTHSAFAYSLSSVHHLYIEAESISENSTTWDYAGVLRQFSDLSILELENLGSVVMEGDDSFPFLRDLYLHSVEIPRLGLYLPRYPNLEELLLTGEIFALQPLLQDVTLPMLSLLQIDNSTQGFPWSRLTAPSLKRLAVGDDDETCNAFICRHPSILNLEYNLWIEEDEFNAFARSLVALEVFSMGGSIGALFRQTDAETPFPSFPKLKELTIDTRENHPLSVQDFEDFTRLHCPSRQTQAQGHEVERVTVLSILIPTSDLSSSAWRKSPLMVHWKETITKDTEDGTLTTINLVPAE